MRIRAFSHRTTPPALLACLLAVAGAALGGCAAPATVDGMRVGPGDLVASPASFPLAGTLAVGEVTGGEETNPMWTPEVGNDAFREALESSLGANRLLAGTPGDAVYLLHAHLLDLDQPVIALDVRLTARVRYELARRVGGERLWEDTIAASHAVTVGEEFLYVERVRRANEGVIRENIKALVERLQRFPE